MRAHLVQMDREIVNMRDDWAQEVEETGPE